MKIISWNVNGLRAIHKKGAWADIWEEVPDVLCLQETKSQKDQLPVDVANVSGYDSFFSWPTLKKGYSGVAVYTNKKSDKIEFGMGAQGNDDEGRLISLFFEKEKIVLINGYFPNGGGGEDRLSYKLDFYEKFLKYIEGLRKAGYGIIFCGDVNTAHKEIDLSRPKENETHTGFLPIERAWLDKVVNAGYIDVFRHFNPDKKEAYTWWDMKTFSRERNVGWRIDYFFVSPDLLPKIKSIKHLTNVFGSDHCPIALEIKL